MMLNLVFWKVDLFRYMPFTPRLTLKLYCFLILLLVNFSNSIREIYSGRLRLTAQRIRKHKVPEKSWVVNGIYRRTADFQCKDKILSHRSATALSSTQVESTFTSFTWRCFHLGSTRPCCSPTDARKKIRKCDTHFLKSFSKNFVFAHDGPPYGRKPDWASEHGMAHPCTLSAWSIRI